MQNHNDTMNKDERRLLLKIYLSLYLKGLCLWEGVGDRTELQHIDPHSYDHQRCVFLVLQGCSTGGPGPQLSAECWLSLPHLVTNGSGLQTGLQTNWLPVFTELYNSSIAHSISLEWHVWSSSSGNNCHAVHRSLSSGASIYDCTMRFYLVPYCQPSPPRRFLPITAIRMCHFRRLWNGMLAGSKISIQHKVLILNVMKLIRGSLKSFQTFFRWGNFIDSTHMKL